MNKRLTSTKIKCKIMGIPKCWSKGIRKTPQNIHIQKEVNRILMAERGEKPS